MISILCKKIRLTFLFICLALRGLKKINGKISHEEIVTRTLETIKVRLRVSRKTTFSNILKF